MSISHRQHRLDYIALIEVLHSAVSKCEVSRDIDLTTILREDHSLVWASMCLAPGSCKNMQGEVEKERPLSRDAMLDPKLRATCVFYALFGYTLSIIAARRDPVPCPAD